MSTWMQRLIIFIIAGIVDLLLGNIFRLEIGEWYLWFLSSGIEALVIYEIMCRTQAWVRGATLPIYFIVSAVIRLPVNALIYSVRFSDFSIVQYWFQPSQYYDFFVNAQPYNYNLLISSGIIVVVVYFLVSGRTISLPGIGKLGGQSTDGAQRENQMYTYQHTSKASGVRLLVAVVALSVTVGVVWMALTTRDLVNRIWLILIGIGGGWTALNMGLRLLFMNPTLTISDEGIKVSGYWPASDTNNWTRELHWSEIGRAKIAKKEIEIKGPLSSAKVKTVSLLLYAREESEKVAGTVADFEKFEKSDEIAQVIGQRLGQPVTEESVQEVR